MQRSEFAKITSPNYRLGVRILDLIQLSNFGFNLILNTSPQCQALEHGALHGSFLGWFLVVYCDPDYAMTIIPTDQPLDMHSGLDYQQLVDAKVTAVFLRHSHKEQKQQIAVQESTWML